MRVEEENRTKPLKWVLLIFRILGIYQRRKNLLTAYTLVSIWLLSVWIAVETIMTWEDVRTLEKFIFFPSFFVTLLKMIVLCVKGPQLYKLVAMIDDFWKAEDFGKELSEKSNQIFRSMSLICSVFKIGCLFISLCNVLRRIFLVEQRTLVYTDLAFCDLQSLYCWIILYAWQTACILYQIVPGAVAMDILFIICTTHVTNGCMIFRHALKYLNTDNSERRDQLLKKIVHQHIFMMAFIETIEDLYSTLMLTQFVCSLFSMMLTLNIIVVNGFPPSLDRLMIFGTIYILFVFQILIYAMGGTIIEDQIKKLATSIYDVEWYGSARIQLRKDLSLMIFRAQNAKAVSVGKVADLNLPLFLDTMRASLSVFTLIRQLSGDSI